MREILFRGKRVDNGEWVEGAFFHPATTIIDYKCSDFNSLKYPDYIIDPETVGQYTGIKDKNGKRIFEGDIFKFNDEIWSSSYTSYGTLEFAAFLAGLEIVGNIHDNPELLRR